ncbi:ydjO [Escherichia coli]|nr:ydjO [Escherichia coli]
MMSLWDALRMNMMISYQELVRTFLRFLIKKLNRGGKAILGFYIKSISFYGRCIFIILRITYTINRKMKNSPINN